MRLDGHRYTPDLCCRLVTLSGQLRSAEAAAQAIGTAARVQISSRHLQRLTLEVGTDLARLRDEQAAQRRRRTLPARVAPPPVAVVEVDGGRLQTREPGVGPGVQQPQPKENKLACLLSLRSETSPVDPQPEPPAAFRDHERVLRLVRGLKGHVPALDPAPAAVSAVAAVAVAPVPVAPSAAPAALADITAEPIIAEPVTPLAAPPLTPRLTSGAVVATTLVMATLTTETVTPAAAPATPAAVPPAPTATPPPMAPPRFQRLVRTCVASMYCSDDFGPLVAGEAQARGFYDAPRQAYLGDGQLYNWTIHKTYFPHFEAIADVIHVLSYLYLAAWAVAGDDASRWTQYERWLTLCWAGRVNEVIAELATWQEQLGRAPPEAELHDPRRLVQEALTYLRNNAERMDYPRYRRQGLPVTSSWVESLVGEFNVRVKGWDKHYNRGAGVEAILQVRAAVLSEDERLERYFAERPGNPYRRHPRPVNA